MILLKMEEVNRTIRCLKRILGGAPCNVLAMLQKLGYTTAFIGKVGNDAFGRMLGETLSKVGIVSFWIEITIKIFQQRLLLYIINWTEIENFLFIEIQGQI